MASMTSMFTGLSGLSSNSQRLDIIGNNIANVNTTAFKSNRISFAPTFSRNFSLGTAPGAISGGSNPVQVGLGTTIAGTQRNFSNGAISATGVATDLAIEGGGMFVVRDGDQQLYTRSGSFQRNEENDLVSITGARVMGYAVDSDFNILANELVPVNIPIGSLTLAEATRNIAFSGNVNPSGTIATTGSVHSIGAMYTSAALDTPMDGTEDLVSGGTDLYFSDPDGVPILGIEAGSNTVLTLSGFEKAGQNLGTFTFGFMDAATAEASGVDGYGSTMNDFIDFMDNILGLNQSTIDGQTLGGGITINGDGEVVITGNEGTVQDLRINTGQISATSDTGLGAANPFVVSREGDANGESVRTSFVVYDSLGSPVTVDLSFVLQETVPGEGSSWMYIAESTDHDALGRIVGQGVVRFDSEGSFVGATDQTFAIARANGADTPLTVTMNFNSGADAISALTDNTSSLSATFQDGSAIGTLSNFSIGTDGRISGSFTNGLTRTIGQVALAKFSNPEGLVDMGNNMFAAGPNSGDASVASAGEFGTGRIIGGALELSNVDLSQEFINMILASTGYSASSRVITTTNELIQQLLVLGR